MNAKIASAFSCCLHERHGRGAQQPTVNDRVAKAMPTSYQRRRLQDQAEPLQGRAARAGYLKSAHRDRRAREQGAHPRPGREGAPGGDPAERPGQEPRGLVLPGPDLPAGGQAAAAPTPALTRAEQLAPDCAKDISDLPPECLGRADQRGEQVRGGEERRLRPGAVPAGELDLPGSPIPFYRRPPS